MLALAGLLALVLLAWLVLQWAILPRIEYWRPDVERRAAQALGVPVRIGAIEVKDAGFAWRWARAIELREVVVYRPASADAAPASAASSASSANSVSSASSANAIAPTPAAPALEALRLPSVRVALSPASFLPGLDGHWRLRLDQLLISGAQLDVRRERDGRIFVAGLPVGGGPDAGGEGADWVFSQPELAIRGGRVVWTDVQRDRPPVALDAVDLIVRNGVRSHSLRLDATPPAALGARFSLRGDFTRPLIGDLAQPGRSGGTLLSRPGDWRRWRGTAYAELPETDLQALNRHVDLPIDVARGVGSLRLWVDIERAQPVAATVDVALRDLDVRETRRTATTASRPGPAPVAAASAASAGPAASAPEPFTIAKMAGRMTVRLDQGHDLLGRSTGLRGGQLRAEDFGFTMADGVTWPASDFNADWRTDADGRWTGGSLKAPRLDLKLMASVVERLPAHWLGEPLRQRLATLAPEGIASEIEARWDGALPLPQRYAVKAKLNGLGLAALPAEWPASAPAASDGAASAPTHPPLGRPGVAGADIEFSATEAGGEARIALRKGALDFPGVFEDSRVPFDRLDGDLSWRFEGSKDGVPTGLEVRMREVRFANADAQGEFQGRWTRALAPTTVAQGAGPGHLELTGRLDRAAAVRVARYLPLGLPVATRHYVERAVQGGQASAVNFKVRGDLKDFPFGPAKEGEPNRAGEFRITARLDQVQFAYISGDGPPGPPSATVPNGANTAKSASTTNTANTANAAVPASPPAAASSPAPPREPQPAWPVFTQVQGQLVFDRQSMELRNLQGRLGQTGSGDFQLTRVRGGIADMAHAPRLAIEGAGRGPLGDLLAYVNATPISGWIGGVLAQASQPPSAQRNPPAELQLALDIPLNHANETQTRGTLVLAGNDLRLRPDVPLLANTRARISWTERSFNIAGGASRLLGGEASFEGGTQPDGSLRFTGQGTATAEGLRSSDVETLSRPAGVMSGQTGYRLVLGVQHGHADWQVTTNLVGMGVELPSPLGKSAEATLPLRVALAPMAGASGAGAAAGDIASVSATANNKPAATVAASAAAGPGSAHGGRDQLRVEVGPDSARVFQAVWQRENGPQGARVLRGGIGVLDAPTLPAQGVVAQVNLERLDADAWRTAVGRMVGAAPPAAAALPAAAASGAPMVDPPAAPRAPGAVDAMSYAPSVLNLRAQRVDLFGRQLHRVTANVSYGSGTDEGRWRAKIDADELSGDVEYLTPRAAARREPGAEAVDDATAEAPTDAVAASGRVQARLARLILPRQESDAVSNMLDQASPTTLPALDITVDELELHGKRLGRIEIDAVNRPADNGRGPGEWVLNKFRLATADAALSATGRWGATEAQASATARRRAVMDFRLDIADGGALLDRLGQKDVLRGAKGRLAGQVSWLGSPMSIDHPSLNGKVRVDVEGGQFLKADPGIAKLLGVLSLQALPRRLLLDFRDVFAQGFAFDSVDGDVDIAQGVAGTRNLRMRGVQATVLMEGRADIARETQDLRVWVVPEINAGAASLAVAVINPAVGIGSFLAQLFLRKPLVEANTREFHITGPWAEPRVDRVERERATPPPPEASAPAASAASAPAGETVAAPPGEGPVLPPSASAPAPGKPGASRPPSAAP